MLVESYWNVKCTFHKLDYPLVVYKGKGIIVTGKLNSRTRVYHSSTVSDLYNELDDLKIENEKRVDTQLFSR